MRTLTTVLFIILLTQPAVFSQTELLEKRITVKFSDQKIKDIIIAISNQENIRFSYGKFKDLNNKKSISFKNAKLKFILARLFENTDIRYMAFSDQIILVETTKFPRIKYIIGYIVDNETNSPVPYATVMYIKSGEGIISDYEGRFELEINTNSTDTLKFSSLSYQSKKIPVQKIIDKNSIKISLEKKAIPIDPVHIKASDYSAIFMGNNGLINVGTLYLDTHGQEVALYIQNEKKINGKLDEIHFKLSSKGNIDAPFRIRIYEKDSTGHPGKDILKDILVVKPDSKDNWYSVNIADYNIFLPKNGLFISMGGVFPNDFNFYFGDNDFENLSEEDIPKNPEDLSYGQRIYYNKKGKNNTWHYSLSRDWFQIEKKYFNVMIKAKINYKKSKK